MDDQIFSAKNTQRSILLPDFEEDRPAEENEDLQSITHSSSLISLGSYTSMKTTGSMNRLVNTSMMNKHLRNKLSKIQILIDKSRKMEIDIKIGAS